MKTRHTQEELQAMAKTSKRWLWTTCEYPVRKWALTPVRNTVVVSSPMLARDEHTENQRLRKIQELRTRWNAPKRHVNKKPRIEGKWGETLAKIKSRIGRGCFIALVGLRGNGKTQLGVEAMRVSTNELRAAFYDTAYGFFLSVRSCYNLSERTERDVLNDFRKPPMLVMDELAKRSDKDWENRLLFHLLDCRYMDEKDTIVIANQTESDFAEMIGPSLARRMRETGGLIHCDWEAFV